MFGLEATAVGEEEEYLWAIASHPGDQSARAEYAAELDRRGDPRAKYVRAEDEWAARRSWDVPAPLRDRAAGFDPTWVARLSRPPLGVCADHLQFDEPVEGRHRPRLTAAVLGWVERRFGLSLPADYRAFLLNYNGGRPRGPLAPSAVEVRLDWLWERCGIAPPTGYYNRPVACLSSARAAAEPAFDPAAPWSDWDPDLVYNLRCLEHYRGGGWDDPLAGYWSSGPRRDLIWVGHGVATGDHELFCLRVRGAGAGEVYAAASGPGHSCSCEDTVLVAPTFAAFLGLLAPPAGLGTA